MIETASKSKISNKSASSQKSQKTSVSTDEGMNFLKNNLQLLEGADIMEVKHICDSFYRVNFYQKHRSKDSIFENYRFLPGDHGSRFYKVVQTPNGLQYIWISDTEAKKRWKKE